MLLCSYITHIPFDVTKIFSRKTWSIFSRCQLLNTKILSKLLTTFSSKSSLFKISCAHIILNKLDFDENVVKSFDKIFVLSNWHRENIDHVLREKIFVTSNGI